MSELRRVLYVEDDVDIQAIARLALEVIGGFDVYMCASGAEALAVAVEFEPDLIVLDMMMPGMDGRTTLDELRRLPGLDETPAVFVTAKVDRTEVARYRESGVLGVIKKPFDPLGLGDDLRTMWDSASA